MKLNEMEILHMNSQQFVLMSSVCPCQYLLWNICANFFARNLVLWLAIRAISTKKMALQEVLGVEFRKVVATQMLLEGTRSFDMLEGLLVFAAWGHYYICFKPIMTTIIQLAISLASDLALTKSVPLEPTR
jgi:hypothetical protein